MKTRIGAWILALLLIISLWGGSDFSALVAEGAAYALPQEEEYAACLDLDLEELAQLKELIFEAAIDYKENCDISAFEIPYNSETMEVMGDIVYKGHPEVFHIQNLSFSYRTGSERILTRVNFARYKYDQTEYTRRVKACRDAADDLLEGIADSSLSDVEKALLLHDRLAVLCDYDYANFILNAVPEEDYTMYGALVKRSAVCEGYVQAYRFLLEKVGIESSMCSSYTLGHAWNIVMINGKPYHVDVTWDDPVEDITGRVQHTNFLRSTAGIIETGHTANDYDTSPKDTAYDKAFWQDSQSAFQVLNGKIYYIDNEAEALLQWKGDKKQELCRVEDVWRAGSNSKWSGNYARLGSDGAYLYYTLSDAVYRYDPQNGAITTAYQPPMPGDYFGLYGFKVEGDYFYCDLHNSPNFTPNTKEEYQIVYPYRTVKAKSMTVAKAPTKTTYLIGEALNTAGLKLAVTYSNNVTETVEDGFEVSGYDATVEGKQTLTVTYQGVTATFEVFVEKPPVDDGDDGNTDDGDADDGDTDDGNTDDDTDDGDQEPATKGDVDGDNTITSTDARMTLQYYAGKITASSLSVSAADVDSDGTITSTDARLILQYYAGKITEWP